jgi:hypothetical protein
MRAVCLANPSLVLSQRKDHEEDGEVMLIWTLDTFGLRFWVGFVWLTIFATCGRRSDWLLVSTSSGDWNGARWASASYHMLKSNVH